MPRPRTGLKTVARKRPDGTLLRTDYYHRATGAYLGSDREAALRAAAAASRPARPTPVTFGDLVTSYLVSPEYAALAPRTRKLNRLYVDDLRGRYGDLPATAITRAAVRRLRDAHAAQPVKGNRMVATLRLVLGHGVQIGTLLHNAASRPGRLRERPRTALYTDTQIAAFLAAAGPALRRAMALLLYTVQRPGDVLAMSPRHLSERDGRTWITLRQQKTGELIDVPLHSHAAAILATPLPPPTSRRAAARIAPALLVPSPTGRPWAYRNFARAWDLARARADYRLARQTIATWPPRANRTPARTAKLKADLRAEMLQGLQRRDLRRSGMVRMAQAGATPQQIAAVSGHTIDHVMRILDVYIPRRGEVALEAITAWESGLARGQVIALHSRPQPIDTGFDTNSANSNKRSVTP
jgi:integrase